MYDSKRLATICKACVRSSTPKTGAAKVASWLILCPWQVSALLHDFDTKAGRSETSLLTYSTYLPAQRSRVPVEHPEGHAVLPVQEYALIVAVLDGPVRGQDVALVELDVGRDLLWLSF